MNDWNTQRAVGRAVGLPFLVGEGLRLLRQALPDAIFKRGIDHQAQGHDRHQGHGHPRIFG